MGARVPQITLIFFHKNKSILTEFPWLVKELEYSTEKPLQIFTFGMAEIDWVVHGMSPPTQKLDLPPSIHCGREDDLLKKVPAHMMGATKGEKKALSS
jgi:hypothetical protein